MPEAETSVPSGRSLRDRIEVEMPRLGAKQRLVAQFCLSNPSQLLFGTATEVASQSGVDPATVVRFAQRLGYSGYPELREALRTEYPQLRTASQRIDDELESSAKGLDSAALLARVRARTLQNLEETLAQINPEAMDQLVERLFAARLVHVVGAGQSAAIGIQFFRTLQTAQIPALPLVDWYDLLYAGASIQAGDVVFGITVWHYSRVTIEALRVAREAGAWSTLLTDAPYAPGADIADLTLFFSPHAVGEYLSPVAGAAVIDSIAALLAAREPARMKHGLSYQTQLAGANRLTFQ